VDKITVDKRVEISLAVGRYLRAKLAKQQAADELLEISLAVGRYLRAKLAKQQAVDELLNAEFELQEKVPDGGMFVVQLNCKYYLVDRSADDLTCDQIEVI